MTHYSAYSVTLSHIRASGPVSFSNVCRYLLWQCPTVNTEETAARLALAAIDVLLDGLVILREGRGDSEAYIAYPQDDMPFGV